jgi:RNA 3'-terminal phosphate cyclase (ATP)
VQLVCNRVTKEILPIQFTTQGQMVKVIVHGFFTPDLKDCDFNEAAYTATLKKRFGAELVVEYAVQEIKGARDRACGIMIEGQTDSGMLFGHTELCGKSLEKIHVLMERCLDGFSRNIGEDGFVCVDEYMQDQLIIFMSLAKGVSVIHTGPLTLHTKTAIFFCGKITGAAFVVEKVEQGRSEEIDIEADVDYEKQFPKSRFRITCTGIGFKR